MDKISTSSPNHRGTIQSFWDILRRSFFCVLVIQSIPRSISHLDLNNDSELRKGRTMRITTVNLFKRHLAFEFRSGFLYIQITFDLNAELCLSCCRKYYAAISLSGRCRCDDTKDRNIDNAVRLFARVT